MQTTTVNTGEAAMKSKERSKKRNAPHSCGASLFYPLPNLNAGRGTAEPTAFFFAHTILISKPTILVRNAQIQAMTHCPITMLVAHLPPSSRLMEAIAAIQGV